MRIKPELKPYVPLFLSLGLAVVLVFLVEDFIQTVIIGPLLYAAWFFSLILQSLPQGFIWTVFILILLVWAISGLSRWQAAQRSSRKELPPIMGQVERWTRALNYAQANPFSRWRLAQELKRLSRKLRSPVGANAETGDQQDDLDLPDEILAYFAASQPSLPTFSQRIFGPSEETTSALDLDPEIVIDYLEAQLTDQT